MSEESDQNHTIILKNILVAMDMSDHSYAALKAAAMLAKSMEADMHGLFVHEEKWRTISKLPSVSEVNELTGDIRPVSGEDLEKQLQILDHRIRRRFELITGQYKIRHKWTSVQGSVEDKVLEAAGRADLITIGSKGKSYIGRKSLGRSAKAVIERTDKPVLILREGLDLGRSVIVVYDASLQSQKGLRLARLITEKNQSKMIVLAMREAAGKAGERDEELQDVIEDSPVRTEVQLLKEISVSDFLNIINKQFGGLLVMARNDQFLSRYSIELFIEHVHDPILLMPG